MTPFDLAVFAAKLVLGTAAFLLIRYGVPPLAAALDRVRP